MMKVGLLFGGYMKAPPDQLKLPTAPKMGPSWEERVPGLSRESEETAVPRPPQPPTHDLEFLPSLTAS